MVSLNGEQERYSFDPHVSDYNSIHCEKYPIKLNPLFATHAELRGLFLKESRDFIRYYYPSQYELLTTTLFCESFANMREDYRYSEDIRNIRNFIAENECKRLRNVIQYTAHCIWKEIQAL
ncbi:hypothetical protein I4U23_031532 [Adineta vaga]|nr:hypothetical protein I4U23_031532 [Adineta vaga]